MTDYELLTLAAKAIGEVYCAGKCVSGLTKKGFVYMEWNPLIDDGDALRLAVKIGVRDYFGLEVQETCSQATCFEPWEHCEYEYHKNSQDPYAATRRAIVRAAAEIGRSMT